MPVLRDVFIELSKNKTLNKAAQKYGLKLGAQSVVAGTTISEMIESVKKLNTQGVLCTVNNIGEFVNNRKEVLKAKEHILDTIEALHENGADAHISIKPSQLGLKIEFDFCYDNILEIVKKAKEYDIFVNLDQETYELQQPTFELMEKISKNFDNIGTVIQAYFFNAKEKATLYKDYRLRIVKGAYKEPANVAYQEKIDIDLNFIELIEYHLLNGKFTSIATHDHNIINHVKQFVEIHGISKEKFEFQMLYGFRKELQEQLTKEGYQFCTYVPFGTDWYGYFMRRLAERPQNINLVTKQVFNKKTNTIIGLTAAAFILGRLSKNKKS